MLHTIYNLGLSGVQLWPRRIRPTPGWLWIAKDIKREAQFQLGISALSSFMKRSEATEISRQLTENNFPLGRWVSNLRTRYKAGRLLPEEIRRVEALPNWQWSPLTTTWEQCLTLTHEYCRTFKTADVPYDLEINSVKLGNWVSAQKALYRKKKLDKKRAKLLSQIPGWNWGKQKSGPKNKRPNQAYQTPTK